MTENEIREYIVNECQNTRCQYLRKDNECVEDGNCFEVKRQIIAILEEIQQYRAIGTVEDVTFYKKCYDEESYEFCGEYGTDNCGCKGRMEVLEKKVAEIESIGTIEEFKALK